MRNSILHLLHMRHQHTDTMNLSIEALGEIFGTGVLQMIQRQHLPIAQGEEQEQRQARVDHGGQASIEIDVHEDISEEEEMREAVRLSLLDAPPAKRARVVGPRPS